MADKKPGRGSDQFPLRLPDGMRDRIKAAADQNGRSMNAEIISTLEDAYPDPASFNEELDFLSEIDDIRQKLERLRMTRMPDGSPKPKPSGEDS